MKVTTNSPESDRKVRFPGRHLGRTLVLGLALWVGTSVQGAPGAVDDTHSEAFKQAYARANALQIVFRAVYARVRPSVVSVEPELGRARHSKRTGTGFVIHESGVIVTNAHVVGEARFARIKLHDGRRLRGQVRGMDRLSDIAIIKIRPFRGIRAVELGDSDALHVGDLCIAVGNPFGFEGSFTTGVVSGVRRRGLDGSGLAYIQTDASINHGNSGGPLLDLRGRVIGINRMIVSPYGGSVGVSFAIPINQVRPSIAQMQRGGQVERPMLGVRIGHTRARGLAVAEVIRGSGAWKAGVRPGDLIMRIDGRRMGNFASLISYILTKRIGDTVELLIKRKRRTRKIKIRLGRR